MPRFARGLQNTRARASGCGPLAAEQHHLDVVALEHARTQHALGERGLRRLETPGERRGLAAHLLALRGAASRRRARRRRAAAPPPPRTRATPRADVATGRAAGTRAGPRESRIDRRTCAGGVTGRTPEAMAAAAARRSREQLFARRRSPRPGGGRAPPARRPPGCPVRTRATSSSYRSLCAIASTPKVRAQPLPKFHQSEPDPCLDGPERRSRAFGDLLLRQTLEIGQLERPPLVLGQLARRRRGRSLPTRGRPRRPRRRPARPVPRRCLRGSSTPGARATGACARDRSRGCASR